MVFLIWLLVAVPATSACGGVLDCLRSDLLQAFSRIAASDSYRLLPGLTFDRRKDHPRALGTGGPLPEDVYGSAERIFKSHSLFWNVLPGVDLSVSEGTGGKFVLGVERCRHEAESRTFKFGMMRRMKLIMLPIMYKLGVITTLLTLLTVFALKGLTIGVLLLVMTSAGLAAKFKYAHYGHGPPQWPSGKEVHVHVHGGGSPHSYHSSPVHFDDPWGREDKPPQSAQGGPWGPQPYHHNQPHQPSPSGPLAPSKATQSPWASYIGDHTL